MNDGTEKPAECGSRSTLSLIPVTKFRVSRSYARNSYLPHIRRNFDPLRPVFLSFAPPPEAHSLSNSLARRNTPIRSPYYFSLARLRLGPIPLSAIAISTRPGLTEGNISSVSMHISQKLVCSHSTRRDERSVLSSQGKHRLTMSRQMRA